MAADLLNRGYMWNEISAAKRLLKLFQDYFGDVERVEKNILEPSPCLRNNFEIMSGKFLCAEIKLLQTDVDEG